ncbi:hypothetical protein ASA1KI_28870 [Opitutales bacterium ASA1]|uniref:hypothetical protein n=1 Tax=Congregicoccus parvus TaxID=3081749 RepID=UPI002B2A7416|nr:hypothetical protein ASA1KI_28870 [Opitutales bacterium ASA1]
MRTTFPLSPGKDAALLRGLTIAFVALAAATAAWHAARAIVDVPYWDDFDGYLAFLLRIEDAPSFAERFRIATEFHNEHRTLASRLGVWIAHEFGAAMNFRVLGAIGATMFVPAVWLLAGHVREPGSRRAVWFFGAAMLFNLQHWENLFWGGSSADHVTIVPLALVALFLAFRPGRAAHTAALATATLAAYTLAHGLLVFPVAAGLLAWERRWRACAVWTAATLVIAVSWWSGFPATGNEPAALGPLEKVLVIFRFWLGLLGAPLAFGSRAVAPWIGAGLVVAAAALTFAGVWNRNRTQAAYLAFAALSLVAIAYGRAVAEPSGFIVFRYRILSCLVVALLAWGVFDWLGRKPRAFALPARTGLCALLAGLWLEQTIDHWWRSDAFHAAQMSAVAHYHAHGTLEGAPRMLYYDVPKADDILRESAKRRIYILPPTEPPARVSPESR